MSTKDRSTAEPKSSNQKGSADEVETARIDWKHPIPVSFADLAASPSAVSSSFRLNVSTTLPVQPRRSK